MSRQPPNKVTPNGNTRGIPLKPDSVVPAAVLSSHKSILDGEGIEVADINEARAFAREAVAEMVQDGVAEIAHWRGWEIETRDASGAVLFTIGFDALLPPEARGAEVQAPVAVSSEEDGTYAYGKAA